MIDWEQIIDWERVDNLSDEEIEILNKIFEKTDY